MLWYCVCVYVCMFMLCEQFTMDDKVFFTARIEEPGFRDDSIWNRYYLRVIISLGILIDTQWTYTAMLIPYSYIIYWYMCSVHCSYEYGRGHYEYNPKILSCRNDYRLTCRERDYIQYYLENCMEALNQTTMM